MAAASQRRWAAVRQWGGVLEHPAGTHAWRAHGLVVPQSIGWTLTAPDEWVCEVYQSAYGHAARKRTWLLYVGTLPPLPMNWARRAGTHQVGWFDRVKPSLNKRASCATPPAFRDAMLALARRASQQRHIA